MSAPSWDERRYPLVRPAMQSYSDVPPTHQLYAYVETARSRGMFAGEADGANFLPENDLTRGAAALWLWNLMRSALGQ